MSAPATPEAVLRSRDILAVDAQRHKRSKVPFGSNFIYRTDGETTRLVQLLSGDRRHPGRGGDVRLKLYLCITMMATSHPYDIKREIWPLSWATRIGLSGDPRSRGRRISYNMNWLEAHNYIDRDARKPPVVTLLAVDGSGDEYEPPRGSNTYANLPIELYTHGWLAVLSPASLALLLVISHHVARHGQPEVFFSKTDKRRYSLSGPSWTEAGKELQRYGLLMIRPTIFEGDNAERRRRNLYSLREMPLAE